MINIKKNTILYLLFSIVFMFLGTVEEKPEWKGEMTPKTLTLSVGETGKVTAKQTGTLIVRTPATYISSNTSIATVDSNGNVRGLRAGTVTITGKFDTYIAGTTTVTVEEKTEWKGEMTPKTLTLSVGETGKVTATQTGTLIVRTPAVYTSSNTSIATVDSNGNVRGLKAGSVTITGKFDTYTAGTTTVTVEEKTDWKGEMSPESLVILVGDTALVTAKQTGTLIVRTPAVYTSSDTSIATVDSHGIVTGLKPGTVTITGMFDKYIAGTTTLTVDELVAIPKWEGTTTTQNNTISVGSTTTVSVKQTGDVTIGSDIVYSSSDPTVASVDENGVVTALKPGSTTINAKVGNSLVADGITINVTESGTSSESNNTKLYIAIGCILAIVLVVIYIIYNKKKQKNN